MSRKRQFEQADEPFPSGDAQCRRAPAAGACGRSSVILNICSSNSLFEVTAGKAGHPRFACRVRPEKSAANAGMMVKSDR
jgi:hypothetical protein